MNHRVLIRDRDSLFAASFTSTLEGAGVRNVLTPVRALICNAYAERSVLTIKPMRLGAILKHFRQAAWAESAGLPPKLGSENSGKPR